jgi:protein-tyrosine phosphatase
MEVTLEMLRGLAGIGFSHVVATPHQKASQFMPERAAIDDALGRVRAASRDAGIPVEIGLAAENFWDDVFFQRSKERTVPAYDGGKAFLFEIPPSIVPPRFEDALFEYEVQGRLPVMAHPERYQPFWKDLDRLAAIGRSCALVVDLAAVAGHSGWTQKRFSRRLLKERIAHAAASDVHSPADVRSAAEGIAWIKKKLGDAEVKRLLEDNPRQILSGKLP